MLWCDRSVQFLLFGCLFSFVTISPTLAQITPDNTLGAENSVVTENVTINDAISELIEGGAVRENNLFHSFSEFNVPDSHSVYFASPDGIANILTRVTGNNISEIFGTLGVDGAAKLFLLNPNGIVFGENTSLDVNASFLATTADSYLFENGYKYSASNPNTPPLLTINMPVGLQFGTNQEPINVLGKGHNLELPEEDEFILTGDEFSMGLEVPPRNTLALIGGEITLKGSNLTAAGGRVELGSIAQPSQIFIIPTVDGFTFDYRAIEQFNDISLTESAWIEISGNGGGNLQLKGKNIALVDTSVINANTLGDENGGDIIITASESINLIGDNNIVFPSAIFHQVEEDATGNGSNLTITTGKLNISNNAVISSQILGSGDGGNISIAAQEIDIGNGKESFYATGIFSDVLGAATGNGGKIDIHAQTINLADEVSISSDTFGLGKGGEISINTEQLFVDNARIVAGTWGSGDSGKLAIAAVEIELTGEAGLFTDVVADDDDTSEVTGKGGELSITTEQLRIFEGSRIQAGTAGAGDSGNLTIQATDSIEIRGTSLTPEELEDLREGGENEIELEDDDDDDDDEDEIEIYPSGIFVGVEEEEATGNGGILSISTPYLRVADGATISANVFGAGNGGEIFINSNTVEVSNSLFVDDDARTGITSTVELDGTGNGGNINITADDLSIFDGGSISSSARGNGNAGNIQLQVDNIDVSGKLPEDKFTSQIAAFSESKYDAGLIIIDADNLSLRDGAELSVSNEQGGNSGNLDITASKVFLDNATIDARVSIGEQGNINLATDNIFLFNQSEINTNGTETATGGNIYIDNTENIVLFDGSQIVADAQQGNGGNISIITQGLFVSSDSNISASSEFGLDGNIEIDTIESDRAADLIELPENLLDATQQIATGCGANSNFILAGNGGLPENPEQFLRGEAIWQDLRILTNKTNDLSSISLSMPEYPQKSTVIEAQTWKINQQGKLELIAISSKYNSAWNQNNAYCKSTNLN